MVSRKDFQAQVKIKFSGTSMTKVDLKQNVTIVGYVEFLDQTESAQNHSKLKTLFYLKSISVYVGHHYQLVLFE